MKKVYKKKGARRGGVKKMRKAKYGNCKTSSRNNKVVLCSGIFGKKGA